MTLGYSKNCYLCRSVPKEIMYDEDKKLDPACLFVEQFPGYSTNMVGRHKDDKRFAQVKDVFIKVHDLPLAKTAWGETDEEVPLAGDIESEIVNDREYLLLKVDDFHNVSGKYMFPVSKSGKEKKELDFTVDVVHKPTRINLYHFQFEIRRDTMVDGEKTNVLVKSIKNSGWGAAIIHYIQDLIINHHELKLPRN